MGDWADNAVNYFMRRGDFNQSVKHDKRRHRILTCPTCGKKPLQFLETDRNKWHLAEFDEDNKLTRHVCKMNRIGKSTSQGAGPPC